MALLGNAQIVVAWEHGIADKFVLFAVKSVNTGDTIDVSQWFSAPKLATVLWATTAKSDKLPTIAGTVITLDTVALNKDSGWLQVWGSSA
jgi:hypothetical protein